MAAQTPEQREALLSDTARMAADMYAAFLSAPIPASGQGFLRFSGEQAFELTRTLLYEAIKDANL